MPCVGRWAYHVAMGYKVPAERERAIERVGSLILSGRTYRQIADELGVHKKQIDRWAKHPTVRQIVAVGRGLATQDKGGDTMPDPVPIMPDHEPVPDRPLGTTLDEVERIMPELHAAARAEGAKGAAWQAYIRACELRAELRSERKVPASMEAVVEREVARVRKYIYQTILDALGEGALRKVRDRIADE